MVIDRRKFLSSAAIAVAGVALHPLLFAASKEAAPQTRGPTGCLGAFLCAEKNIFYLLDFPTGKSVRWKIPCAFPHSILTSPKNPEIAAVIDQDGPDACVVNLWQRRSTTQLKASAGNYFSGHGCFSADGSFFYLAEFPQNKTEEGALVAFETKGWKRVGRYFSGGAQPHYVQPLGDGTVVAIGHYGKFTLGAPMRDGVLSLLNVESGKIQDVIKPKNPEHALCHMDKSDDDVLLITTRTWVENKKRSTFLEDRNDATPVIIGNPLKKDWSVQFPDAFADKMRLNFSVKVDSSRRRAFATHLVSNSISLWDLEGDRKLITTRYFAGECPMGAGLAIGKDLYLTHTRGGKIHFMNPSDLSTAWSMQLRTEHSGIGPHFTLTKENFFRGSKA